MTAYNILLLTNRDSDNVGDQLIEATVMSLISAAMANIGVRPRDFKINSRAAGIISKKYMSTGDEALLADARDAILKADLIIFGGAPLFNYSYQNFYLRTIRTLELAQEYGVPVIFSSIGVEPYSDSNPKSQRLKQALHLPVVRQITTRDDIEAVEQYLAGTQVPRSLVSDPAVFTEQVFDGVVSARKEKTNGGGKKTIGLVVTRAGIFADNGIDFPEAKQREFWLDVIAELEARGDDYRLFTTGHFTDEVFLDSLVRDHGIPTKKVKFAVNSPEEMLKQLNDCDGVIAYRLHASIAAFSYKIPAIGLSWNFKVPYFYETMGYGQRALPAEKWNAATVLAALDIAMEEGVVHNDEFTFSVYETLFNGIKSVFAPRSKAKVYTIEQLRAEIPRYKGTTYAQYTEKMHRKLRRTYESYQKIARKAAAQPAPAVKKDASASSVKPQASEGAVANAVTGAPKDATSALDVRLASVEKRLVAAELRNASLEKRQASFELRQEDTDRSIRKLKNILPIRLWHKLRGHK